MDKKHRWVRVTLSQVISPTPVIISSLIITPKDDKKGYLHLYDGSSVTDPKILTFRTLTGRTELWNFEPVILTQRGLYISFGEDVEELLINYDTDVKD